MKDLKTLKDLTNEDEMNSYSNDNCKDFVKDLRQEAIKWVKNYSKHANKDVGECALFINFFNITEEDLE